MNDKGNQCEVESFQLYLDINLLYPRWKNKSEGSKNLRKSWDRFYQYIEWHENVHKNNAINILKILDGKAQKLTGSNCRVLDYKMNLLINNYEEKLNELNINFDKSEFENTPKLID